MTWVDEMISQSKQNKKSLTVGLIPSVLPALLVAQVCPAAAADIPVVEPTPVISEEAVAAAFDVAFGVALTGDHLSQGSTNSDSKPAVLPYVEASFEATD